VRRDRRHHGRSRCRARRRWRRGDRSCSGDLLSRRPARRRGRAASPEWEVTRNLVGRCATGSLRVVAAPQGWLALGAGKARQVARSGRLQSKRVVGREGQAREGRPKTGDGKASRPGGQGRAGQGAGRRPTKGRTPGRTDGGERARHSAEGGHAGARKGQERGAHQGNPLRARRGLREGLGLRPQPAQQGPGDSRSARAGAEEWRYVRTVFPRVVQDP